MNSGFPAGRLSIVVKSRVGSAPPELSLSRTSKACFRCKASGLKTAEPGLMLVLMLLWS